MSNFIKIQRGQHVFVDLAWNDPTIDPTLLSLDFFTMHEFTKQLSIKWFVTVFLKFAIAINYYYYIPIFVSNK